MKLSCCGTASGSDLLSASETQSRDLPSLISRAGTRGETLRCGSRASLGLESCSSFGAWARSAASIATTIVVGLGTFGIGHVARMMPTLKQFSGQDLSGCLWGLARLVSGKLLFRECPRAWRECSGADGAHAACRPCQPSACRMPSGRRHASNSAVMMVWLLRRCCAEEVSNRRVT